MRLYNPEEYVHSDGQFNRRDFLKIATLVPFVPFATKLDAVLGSESRLESGSGVEWVKVEDKKMIARVEAAHTRRNAENWEFASQTWLGGVSSDPTTPAYVEYEKETTMDLFPNGANLSVSMCGRLGEVVQNGRRIEIVDGQSGVNIATGMDVETVTSMRDRFEPRSSLLVNIKVRTKTMPHDTSFPKSITHADAANLQIVEVSPLLYKKGGRGEIKPPGPEQYDVRGDAKVYGTYVVRVPGFWGPSYYFATNPPENPTSSDVNI